MLCNLSIHRCRPTYPKEIYDKIKQFTDKHSIQLDLVVDIGCGSGHSTFPLSSLCQQVLGIDVSQAQIDLAQQLQHDRSISNVEFKIANVHQIPVDDESVSMITCGEAWHWFDTVTVHRELHRILKSPGCLAVFGYSRPHLKNDQCDVLYKDFYTTVIKGYVDDNTKIIEAHVHNDPGVTFPFPVLERHDFQIDYEISIEKLCGVIESLGTYSFYLKDNPGATTLKDLADHLREISSSDILDAFHTFYLYICLKK